MSKRNLALLLALLLAGLMVATGCQAKPQSAQEQPAAETPATDSLFPLTIKDSAGVDITFEKAPTSVVSLSPSATEMIFALGKGEVLKGRTDYCDYPQEALEVPSMGSIMEPNIEAIVAAKPDVVFVSDMFSTDLRAQIEALGIVVFDLSSHDRFDDVYLAIENAGLILGAQAEGEALVAQMKQTVAEVAEKVKGAEPKTAYYVVGFGESGDYTAGKGTFIDQIITMAGGINAAGDVEGWTYSLEKLIEKDPDYLICRSVGNPKPEIEAANGYKSLTAVKEGRLVEIDSDLLDIQGPRSAEGVLALAKILHPEIFK